MKKIKITVVDGKRKQIRFDWVTEEIGFTIWANKKKLAALLCSPKDLKPLVLGYLYSSGIIKSLSDIKHTIINRKRCNAKVQIKSAQYSDRHIKHSTALAVSSEKIIELTQEFQNSCREFIKTGGVHSAALAGKNKILILKYDLGRHNAIDKVIGEALLKGIDFKDKIILTSGRIPSEILLKIKRCRIPMIASVSAPTAQAVKLARKDNITLIGFLRNNRMNIYSGEKRII